MTKGKRISSVESEVKLCTETDAVTFDAGEVVIDAIDVVEAQELKDIMKSDVTLHVRHKGHGMYLCFTVMSGESKEEGRARMKGRIVLR